MADLTQPHETGADFGAVDCSICGSRRELAFSPYGSLVPAACTCGGEAPKVVEKAKEDEPEPIQEGPEGVPPIQERPVS